MWTVQLQQFASLEGHWLVLGFGYCWADGDPLDYLSLELNTVPQVTRVETSNLQ